MVNEISHFIDGKILMTSSPNWQQLFNPVTGEKSTRVNYADSEVVSQAVASAKKAFKKWSSVTPSRRAQILFEYKRLLERDQPKLAALISKEHGKTIPDAKASIDRGIAVVDFACGIPNLLKGDFTANAGTHIDCYSIRQPLGVCVGITPFNFPAMIPLWMYPLAIACGNTFILKPSPQDPSASLLLAQLFLEAGLPEGVLNVVQGDKVAVDALISHPDVSAVSFVGSTPVAQSIYQTATLHHKRVQCFGGAKNHCIVMPDADVSHAADAIAGAAFGSAGERCMAISVAVAVGDCADQLIAGIKKNIDQMKIGASDDTSTMMGPLVSKQHLARVKNYVDLGVKEGATLLVDGRTFKQPEFPEGNFMGACLFDHVQPNMSIYKDEIFGPVLCIVRTPDFQSALELINNNSYGNGTGIFTKDATIARHFADVVQVGMVGINIPVPVPTATHSFGGWNNSIFADLNMHGPEGVQFYTKLKTITSTWPKSSHGPAFELPTYK